MVSGLWRAVSFETGSVLPDVLPCPTCPRRFRGSRVPVKSRQWSLSLADSLRSNEKEVSRRRFSAPVCPKATSRRASSVDGALSLLLQAPFRTNPESRNRSVDLPRLRKNWAPPVPSRVAQPRRQRAPARRDADGGARDCARCGRDRGHPGALRASSAHPK